MGSLKILRNLISHTFTALTVAATLCCEDITSLDHVSENKYPGKPNISAQIQPNNVNIFTDILVWNATESGSENWAQIFIGDDIDVLDLSFDWDVGVRAGLDFSMRHDQWDSKLYVTWLRPQGKDQANTTGLITSSFLGNFYIGNPDGSKDSGATYRNASIKWKILLTTFDWELARHYWVSSALSLRPFVGIKGGWIHQTIESTWQDPTNSNTFTSATENLKNNFWGIGPSVGLNSKWKLGTVQKHFFSLFGDFSGAILWGHWSFKDIYQNNEPTIVVIDLPNINGGASMLRAFMGFVWDAAPYKEQFYFSFRVGYEAQFWLDQLKFYSFNAGRLDNVLTFQGGTIDLNFNF